MLATSFIHLPAFLPLLCAPQGNCAGVLRAVSEEVERTRRAEVVRVLVGADFRIQRFDRGGHGGRLVCGRRFGSVAGGCGKVRGGLLVMRM